jgi:protein TonB
MVLSLLLAACGSRVPLDTPPARPAPAPASGKVTSPVPAPAARAPARSWAEYHARAAQRLVEANPGKTYLGEVPEPLLAIPVIEVELTADGHVAKINVLRQPSQARDTTQLAIEAIHRAAPFGDVSRLPKPWKYVEVFLYNDDRQFKPRTLDN